MAQIKTPVKSAASAGSAFRRSRCKTIFIKRSMSFRREIFHYFSFGASEFFICVNAKYKSVGRSAAAAPLRAASVIASLGCGRGQGFDK